MAGEMNLLSGEYDVSDGYWMDLFNLGALPSTYDLPELTGLAASETVQTSVLSGPPPIDEEQPAQSSESTKPPETKVRGTKEKVEKKEKRGRQQRFAFMTKSDIDHLEDGYRWRKYGQKSVKNSPFPRSYYKCTHNKCTVKKQVERSSTNRSVVITTYEGRHCHHPNPNPRSKTTDTLLLPLSPSAPVQINFQTVQFHHISNLNNNFCSQLQQFNCKEEKTLDGGFGVNNSCPKTRQFSCKEENIVDGEFDDLLGDMVLPDMGNETN